VPGVGLCLGAEHRDFTRVPFYGQATRSPEYQTVGKKQKTEENRVQGRKYLDYI